MGLWSNGLERAQQKNISKDLEYFLEIQTKVKSFSVRNDKSEIVDIEGSVEIYPEMLRDGKLAFKIGKVTGDFICCCQQIDNSVFPEHLEGRIIFRNELLGTTQFKIRFNIGETVYFFDKNRLTHGIVKEINISSCYDKDMKIATVVKYNLGYQGIEKKEDEIFKSPEEMMQRFEKSDEITSKHFYSVEVKYNLGYKAWFMNNDLPTSQFITVIDISMTDESVISKTVIYSVNMGNEKIALKETDIYDSKIALLAALR